MHAPATNARLRKMRDLFTAEINRQAEQLAAASCRGRIERLTEALRAFAFEPIVTVRAAEVWEDAHGLLPPKIVAELTVFVHEGELRHRFDVPVGPLHRPGKPDRLFELCMLRAEAEQELRGQGEGDGHALDRMLGLAQELNLAVPE